MEEPSPLVLEAQDFITRAFVEAMASHQRHHGLQPRIELLAAAEEIAAPPSHKQQHQHITAAERTRAAASTSQQQRRGAESSATKGGVGQAVDANGEWEADPSYQAFWEWYGSGGYHSWKQPQPWWQQQQQQHGQQQGQQQQQQQGWGAHWQQQQSAPPPPPPPPPPPLPPLFAADNLGTSCPSCGTGTGGAENTTAAAAFLGNCPSDIASDPASKAAAEAAESHALRLTGGNRRIAGLMMAWFYAGYGAARAAGVSGGCGGAAAGSPVKGATGAAAATAAAGTVR